MCSRSRCLYFFFECPWSFHNRPPALLARVFAFCQYYRGFANTFTCCFCDFPRFSNFSCFLRSGNLPRVPALPNSRVQIQSCTCTGGSFFVVGFSDSQCSHNHSLTHQTTRTVTRYELIHVPLFTLRLLFPASAYLYRMPLLK